MLVSVYTVWGGKRMRTVDGFLHYVVVEGDGVYDVVRAPAHRSDG